MGQRLSPIYQRSRPESFSGPLLGVSPLPMWVHDERSLRFLEVNDAALARFGYGRDEFLAMALSDIVTGAGDAAESGEVIHLRIASDETIAVRLVSERVLHHERWVCVVAAIELPAPPDAADENERRTVEQAISEGEAQYREVRAREQRMQRLFEVASDWYWEYDEHGHITYVSPNFEAIYGTPLDGIIGKRLADVDGARIDPVTGPDAAAAIKARKPFRDLIYVQRTASGKTIHVKTSAMPMFDENGEYRGYCGVSKDVTAEVEAEQALRESEQRVRQFLEAASDYYFEQDESYRYTYVSPSYEKMFQTTLAEMRGKRLSDLPGISVDPEMGKMTIRAQKAKQPYRDFRFSRKLADGGKRWLSASAVPIFDASGTFKGYRGVGIDITASIEAESAAHIAQKRLNDAVAHIGHPLVIYGGDDRIVAFNQAFTDLHTAPDVNTPVCLGTAFRDLVEWQMRVNFYAASEGEKPTDLATLIAHYQTEEERPYRLHDGRWMLVVYRGLPGGGRVGLWTDITAVKRAEEERRALEAQLHHSQRLEALGTLAGGVAHDLNNALVPVLGLTRLVANHLPVGSKDRGNLEVVLTGAQRARDLVKQILAFSRKEKQDKRELVEVGQVLREALQMMRASVASSISFVEEIEPVPPIVGDAGQLHQVMINLMTNAAHAIGDNFGTITVGLKLRPDGKHLCLSVADTGCGMDENTKARIFEPFFTTKEIGKGTGLGLSTVHGITASHGGRVELESELGKGTRFDIILPIDRGESAPQSFSATRETE